MTWPVDQEVSSPSGTSASESSCLFSSPMLQGKNAWMSVRRDKVQFFSRCNSYPAKVAPAGSYRSGGGGNETVEAFETTRRLAVWRVSRP